MTAFMTGGWAALLGRLGDQLADPTSLAVLQQRLNRHGAELGGQLPEILLRSGDPEQATRQWLADRDLSHWLPQVHGGTAADGWMFEPAGWNRARGAAAMEPGEIVRTHIDGGMDALLLEGMPATIALESLEAALVAAGISLGISLFRHRREWGAAHAERRGQLLRDALQAAGLGALSGAGLSLVLSIALALVPGGQIWLAGLGVMAVVRTLPRPSGDPFDLSDWASAQAPNGGDNQLPELLQLCRADP
jgi:hypothetical protein